MYDLRGMCGFLLGSVMSTTELYSGIVGEFVMVGKYL